jgi:hypothetical protein
MKDEEAIDWRERFPQLPLNKENKLKEGHGKFWRKKSFYLGFFGKKKRMSVREDN